MTGVERRIILARELLSHPLLEEFCETGFITEAAIRNAQICSEYGELRKKHNHLDSLDILAAKFFISPERVLSILYK